MIFIAKTILKYLFLNILDTISVLRSELKHAEIKQKGIINLIKKRENYYYMCAYLGTFGYGHSIKNFVVRRMMFVSLKMNNEVGPACPGSKAPGRRLPIVLAPSPPPSGSSRTLSRARAA